MTNTITDILHAPSSWDQAAALAAEDIFAYPPQSPGLTIQETRLRFTQLEGSYANAMEFLQQGGSISLPWAAVGSSVVVYARNTGYGFSIDELVDTLICKQRDYGHNNILRFGSYGVIVRCHDKIARLEHLLAAGKKPQNESIRDNLMDVVGYSCIGIMLDQDWFKLELA